MCLVVLDEFSPTPPDWVSTSSGAPVLVVLPGLADTLGSEAAEGDVGDEDEGVDGRAGPGRDGGEADRLLRV